MSVVVTEAVVLHSMSYLETSRILRLITEESGVVSVIARGARRSTKRFSPALDLFAGGTAEIHVRPTRELQTLATFDVTRARPQLGEDLDRYAGAAMLAELALRCAAADDGALMLAAVRAALDALVRARGDEAQAAAVGGAWTVLAAAGVAPAIDVCARCHDPVPADQPAPFAAAIGGVLCARCRGASGAVRTLPVEARDALRAWLRGDTSLPAPTPDAPSLRAHQRLVQEFALHHVLEGQLPRAFEGWATRFSSRA